jgi:hydroxyacylglutathione hydrolase
MKVEVFLVGPLATNCYIVWDEDTKEAMCIDPGHPSPDVIKCIDENGLSLKYIINSHAHADHAGGNKELKEHTGAELLIHPKEEVMLEHIVEFGKMFGIRISPSPPPDRFIQEGDTVTIGDHEFKVLDTPGHSPGSISLSTEGVVFVGDVLFAGSVGRTDLPGGSMPELLESIEKKIFQLGDDVVVYNGHGPSTTVGRERESNPFLQGGFVV